MVSPAIPLAKLKAYPSLSDDVIESLKAFLSYNHFDINNVKFSTNLL